MPDPTKVEYFKDIVATIRDPLVVLDAGLRVLAANSSFYKTFKYLLNKEGRERCGRRHSPHPPCSTLY
jgi:PAS domain-containing protein